jgi:hypothetical protein
MLKRVSVPGGIGELTKCVNFAQKIIELRRNAMITRLCFVLMVISLIGCATDEVGMLRSYGCSYHEDLHGFCCKQQIPDYDKYILTCENGRKL